MSVLIFEIIVFGLALPGMILVSHVPVVVASVAVGASIVLALAASLTLRSNLGFYLGWVTQACAIGLGVLTPWMYAMGLVFALIWVGTFILGKKLDAAKA